MAKLNATQYAEKWGRNLKGSTQDIRNGVQRVTEAPGIAAARKSDKMLAGITEAINSGKWSRAVAGVSLEDWKNATIEKGIGRISAGVDNAMNKQVQMAEQLLAAVDSVVSSIDSMPDTTLEDRIARSAAFQRGMAEKRIGG
tara:strand:+ start:185 stop:610 length:426 start_codon:yes stop_codon:yes gene_type:complete